MAREGSGQAVEETAAAVDAYGRGVRPGDIALGPPRGDIPADGELATGGRRPCG